MNANVQLQNVANIFSILSSLAVIISAFIAVAQLMKMRKSNELQEQEAKLSRLNFLADYTRKRRQSTIDFYNEINQETKGLIDRVIVYKESLSLKRVLKDKNLHRDVRRYLSLMERFSVGIRSYMYDLQIFDRMQGKTTLIMFEALKPYIEYIDDSRGEYFYSDYKWLMSSLIELRKSRKEENYSGLHDKFNKYYSFGEEEENIT